MKTALVVIVLGLLVTQKIVIRNSADPENPAGPVVTCTTTLSAGANIQTTLNSIAAGSTICLNSGSYGAQTITAQKSSLTHVRSVSGQGASLSLTFTNAQNVSFESVTSTSSATNISGSSTNHVEIHDSDYHTNGSQILVNTTDMSAASNIVLLDGNTFGGYDSTGGGAEGTVYIKCNPTTGCGVGLTISHNDFIGGSCADAIQVTNNNTGGFTIGPGNHFHGWLQGSCGPHVDNFQIADGHNITITGNYFETSQVYLGFYDGSDHLTITNNVFDTAATSTQVTQIGCVDTMTMSHNSFRNNDNSWGSKSACSGTNTNWVVENNIFTDGASIVDGSDKQDHCGPNCILRYNAFSTTSGFTGGSGGCSSGCVTNATFTFPGTRSFAGWANWLLSGGSPGKAAGNDGFDMGTLCYGTGGATCP